MILAAIFVASGIFFLTVSSLGVVRLPDFYSRTHAVGKSETLGSILLLLGLAIYHGIKIDSLKIVLILIFIFLANPTATHAIARAAIRSGLQPWVKKKRKEGSPQP
jgi:multicomponent Na+:H+ antiporter subunit G